MSSAAEETVGNPFRAVEAPGWIGGILNITTSVFVAAVVSGLHHPAPGESAVPTGNPESVIAVRKELCWREFLEVKRLPFWMRYAGFRRSTNTVVATPCTLIASVASSLRRTLHGPTCGLKHSIFHRRTCNVFVGFLNMTTVWRSVPGRR